MKLTESQKAIFEKWENALMEFYKFGDNSSLLSFQKDYPNDFTVLRRMNLKRIAIKDSIEPLFMLGLPVYWFTLTFNTDSDNITEKVKKERAQAFMKNIAPLYLLIEEYGEKRTKRYHIHGFCVRKLSMSEEEFFIQFRRWNSRQKLRLLKSCKSGLKRVKYVSKYIVKQVPQIRRSRIMSKFYNYYKSVKKLRRNFNDLLLAKLNDYFDENLLCELYF